MACSPFRRDVAGYGRGVLARRKAATVWAVLLLLAFVTPVVWACPPSSNNTPSGPPPYLTEDPVDPFKGRVAIEATDVVLPGVKGIWSHTRQYSSMLASDVPFQGCGWTMEFLSSYLTPADATSWENAKDFELNVNALHGWLIEKAGGEYCTPEELHSVFTFDSEENEYRLKNYRTRFTYCFSGGGVGEVPGFIKRVEDPYGNTVTYTHDSVHKRISRVTTEQGWTVYYDYVADGNRGKVSRVRVYDGSNHLIQQVDYTYYSGGTHSEDCGTEGDLVMVKVTQRTSAGTLANERVTMYRYYSDRQGDDLGNSHQVKMVLKPASVAQAMDELDKSAAELLEVSDAQIEDYADQKYEYWGETDHYSTEALQYEFGGERTTFQVEKTYNTRRPVKKQYIYKLTTGAIGEHTFYYMDNWDSDDVNRVHRITVEDFTYKTSDPDPVTKTTRRVYGLNKDAQLLREVFIADAATPANKYWCTSYWRGEARTAPGQPNRKNKVLEERGPDAHSPIDSRAEVENFLDADTQAKLNGFTASDGLIRLYDYNEKGKLAWEKFKKKGDANPTCVRVIEYGDGVAKPEGTGVPKHLPVKEWVYHKASTTEKEDANSFWTETAYTFHDDEAEAYDRQQIETKTVTREAIDSEENGSEQTVVTKEYYDAHGRLRWIKDGEECVHYRSYHAATGGLALEIKDVDTSNLDNDADFTGTGGGKWVAWTENNGDAPFTRGGDLPTALVLKTKTEFDSQGRQRQVTDPEGLTMATAYCSNYATRVYTGWADGAATLPIQVTTSDPGGRKREEYSLDPGGVTEGASNGLPTGVDTGESQADYVSWARYAYWDNDTAGDAFNNGLLKWVDRYHKIPDAGNGTLTTDFHRTVNRYEGRGLKTHVIEVVGGTSPEAGDGGIEQVTFTHYDERKRPYKVERGISLAGHNMDPTADDGEHEYTQDPTLKVVSRTYYDGGTHDDTDPDDPSDRLAVGNDLKTYELTFYSDAANENDDKDFAVQTWYHYDWRDRLRGIESEAAPHTVRDVNFRGNVVAEAQYINDDDFGADWATMLAAEDYAYTVATDRRSLTKTLYDEAGRAYRTETYAVNSNGSLGDKLVTDKYYDRNNRVVAEYSPAGGGTEHAFDGAGREFQVRTVTALAGDDGDQDDEDYYNDGAYQYRAPQPAPDLSNLSGGDDKVVQIAHTVYDDVGNVTGSIILEANHDDDTDGLDATAHDDYVQTAVYSWYDSVHRLTTKAVFGTGRVQAPFWQYDTLTRPANEPDESGTDGLVTQHDYDDATGRLLTVTDPKGIETRYFYDDLGRKRYVAENWTNFSLDGNGDPQNTGGADTSEDRVVAFTYDGLGNTLTHTALDPDADGDTSDNQTTTYTFGDPYDASLVTQVQYPDGDATNDNVQATYNLDGQVATRTFQKHDGQQSRTTITFDYDATFRRLTTQTVSSVGDETYDGAYAVRKIETEYDDLSRKESVTSYTYDEVTETYSVLNAVAYTYNTLGALAKEYQEHEGAEDGDTLYVAYAYDDTDATPDDGVFDKSMRLKSIRYPCVGANQHTRTQGEVDARLLHHLYTDAGGSNGVGDALSRVTALASASTRGQNDANVYAAYRYNGTDRLVIEDYTGPNVRLDYADDYAGQHTAGTYENFDRYGRVIRHLWRDYSGNAYLDRTAYTYDHNSNRTWRENEQTTGKDEKYTYDDLNRLTKAERGDRNGDAVENKNRAEDFTLDQVGNWKTYQVDADGDGDATGADDLNQNRTVNDANEITGITEQTDPQQTQWTDPAYDARGNMTTVPQPDDLDASYTCAYDAWNRLVEVKDGARVHARYEYDALNRRVKAHVDSDATGGPDTWVHFYYTNQWQLLETRRTTASENAAPDNLQPHRQYVWSVRYTDALVRRDTNDDADDLCDDETLYALGDANFNTTALVNAAGTVLERYVYDPYGRVTVTDGTWTGRAGSLYESTVLFAGYWRDTETGLYHVRHRMSHVHLGLWLIRDPEGYVDGMSLYAYVRSGPLIGIDPQGLDSWISDDFKKGSAELYEKAYTRAGNSLAKGGLAGWLGFFDGLAEAGCHGVVSGAANLLDVGARQDRVAADARAEVARRAANHPSEPSGAIAVEAVTAAVLKNFPITEGIWGGVEGVYGERLGGVNHGQKFENWGERGAAISTGVASVTGTAAGILKAAGADFDLTLPRPGKAPISSGGAGPVRVGQAAERAVGITGPKTKISINGRVRVPDALTRTTLTEVKNVKSLSFTQQMKDLSAYAKQEGLTMDLYIRPSTHVSQPLMNAVEAKVMKVKFIPGAD